MARKSKALSPRRKRMSRAARLQSGRRWLNRTLGSPEDLVQAIDDTGKFFLGGSRDALGDPVD
jgi:hypothetical protein